MRSRAVCAMLGTVAAAAASATRVADYRESDAAAHFAAFKRDHARSYESAEEEAHRFGVFKETMRRVARVQQLHPEAVFVVNAFSDLGAEEFAARWMGALPAPAAAAGGAAAGAPPLFAGGDVALALAASVDWTERGAVTSVKNQGFCGACWAFATIGTIESKWQIAGNHLVSLSEQEIVTCDNRSVDQGCSGGLPSSALDWIVSQNHGKVYTEKSWPYPEPVGSACNRKGRTVGAVISGKDVVGNDEDQIAAYVGSHGPVAVTVNAEVWQGYGGGILTPCSGRSRQNNHAVTVVGYDPGNSYPAYWKIKNSWGRSWGESGYIRLGFGSGCVWDATSAVVSSRPTPPGPAPPTPHPPHTPPPRTPPPARPTPSPLPPPSPPHPSPPVTPPPHPACSSACGGSCQGDRVCDFVQAHQCVHGYEKTSCEQKGGCWCGSAGIQA